MKAFVEFLSEAKVSTEESDRKQLKAQELQTTIGKGAFNSLIKHPWFTGYSSYEKAYVHRVDGAGFHHVEVFPYMPSINVTSEGKIRPEFRLEFVISHFGKTGKVVQVHKFMRSKEPTPNEIGGGWRHVNSWKD